MVDISALMRVLPVSALEPDWMASLGGFIDVPKDRGWQERIWLLEPPAGQRVPYIEPVEALEKLLRRQGVAPEDAKARALEAVTRMKEDVAGDHWVNFFDVLEPESPECLPLPDFVAWLRNERRRVNRLASDLKLDAQGFKELASEEMLVPSDNIVDFFEQAAEVAASTPMFRGPENWDEAWSLENLLALPPPKAMIEFVPGPPWDNFEWGDWKTGDNPFLRWREAMCPIAQELETALGEPVYYFADLSSDIDDDDVHRFLVLHWCCTHKPESAFVRYLLKVSGARDVEELKAALIDPAIEMEIDEEGQEAVLTALRTGDPQRVLLRVTRKYENTTLLEGVVPRATLSAALKTELIRFFTADFDPQHWDLRDDPEDIKDDHVYIKDTILNPLWLATADSANGPHSRETEAL
ncbi:MAG: hypothetical protein LBI68_02180 [Azoarcus sp.]|jgi:hypothetical protein|nr:hypothetical protein [Azoarcus sp.]